MASAAFFSAAFFLERKSGPKSLSSPARVTYRSNTTKPPTFLQWHDNKEIVLSEHTMLIGHRFKKKPHEDLMFGINNQLTGPVAPFTFPTTKRVGPCLQCAWSAKGWPRLHCLPYGIWGLPAESRAVWMEPASSAKGWPHSHCLHWGMCGPARAVAGSVKGACLLPYILAGPVHTACNKVCRARFIVFDQTQRPLLIHRSLSKTGNNCYLVEPDHREVSGLYQ